MSTASISESELDNKEMNVTDGKFACPYDALY